VLGHPIAHSKSPALHAAAYRQLGLDFGYAAQDLQAEELDGFIRRVRADGNWFGLSVTMPLKTAIVPLLDALEGAAATLGVVNTVVATGVRLVGYNTDVAGIVNALRHAGVREQPSAAILGGGGTAVAAVAALEALGAPAADLFVRDAGRSSAAGQAAAVVGLAHRLRPWGEAVGTLAGYDVVISTLPPHAADALAADLAPGGTTGRLLLDVAYDPWPSGLAAVWEARGGTIVPGLEMLLYQAVEQVRLFTSAALDARDAPSGVGSPALINAMCDAVWLPRR
jgi:shikimate dehydrogenase